MHIAGIMDLCFRFLIPLAFASLAQAAVPSVRVDFNLATETHSNLYGRLKGLLQRPSSPPFDPTNVLGRYVLGPRRSDFHGVPLGWIMVHIVGESPDEKTTLAIANDDLYLLGFANGTDHWHILSGFGGLPDATTLPFDESYGKLIGGHANLCLVPIGKQICHTSREDTFELRPSHRHRTRTQTGAGQVCADDF